MEIYLVGGAVRDELLGLAVKDRDWVVVGGSEAQMLALNYQQVGKGFPVFLHPQSKEEYALARLEQKIGPGYTGFQFDTTASVTLEEDLSRRDLTINAIAKSAQGEFIDPYNGRKDIELRVLRHVSPAFKEDPLRVLRVARFAARLDHLGFRVADETMALMQDMVNSGEIDHLVKERVWQEIEAALNATSPAVFFRLLRQCGALARILPEVDNLFGIPQPEKYHPEIDTGIHTLMCLEQASALSKDPAVRYSSLVHDVGKGLTDVANWPSHHRHEQLGVKLLDDINQRLRVPNEFADLAKLVCLHHTKLHRLPQLRASTVLELLQHLDVFRRPQRMQNFLLACEADSRGRLGLEMVPYAPKKMLQTLSDAACGIDIKALVDDNKLNPRDIGERIKQRRIAAIEQAKASLEI